MPRRKAGEQFWSHVEKTPGCWLWTGARTSTGYGRSMIGGGRYVVAHRVAYEQFRGPIPDGFVLDHLCRVRHCVHPAHLEVVTLGENIRRGVGIASVHANETRCADPNCNWCRRRQTNVFSVEEIADSPFLLEAYADEAFRAALRTFAPFLASGKPVHA